MTPLAPLSDLLVSAWRQLPVAQLGPVETGLLGLDLHGPIGGPVSLLSDPKLLHALTQDRDACSSVARLLGLSGREVLIAAGLEVPPLALLSVAPSVPGLVEMVPRAKLTVGGPLYLHYQRRTSPDTIIRSLTPILASWLDGREVVVVSQNRSRLVKALGDFHPLQAFDRLTGEFIGPWGNPEWGGARLTTDTEGFVYVATYRTGQVLKVSADGQMVHWRTQVPRPHYSPIENDNYVILNRIVVDEHHLFVLNNATQSLMVFDKKNGIWLHNMTGFMSVWNHFVIINDLILCESHVDQIDIFDREGNHLKRTAIPADLDDKKTLTVVGIAADAENGQVFLAVNHQVLVYHISDNSWGLLLGDDVPETSPIVDLNFDPRTGDLLIGHGRSGGPLEGSFSVTVIPREQRLVGSFESLQHMIHGGSIGRHLPPAKGK